jgi:FAD:protein FMN transferase
VRRTAALLGTLVTVHVVDHEVSSRHDAGSVDAAIERAFEWFRQVERTCTRFDPTSELMALTRQVGTPTPASDILYAAVEVALAVAAASDGAFDPTIGRAMEQHGFNRNYLDGRTVETPAAAADVSFRDVHLDPVRKTIALGRPLLLDLGSVAKGLAVDLAARELQPFEDFAIDAGGDLYLAGHNELGLPWRVGLRHPRADDELMATLTASNCAVCTSGDYEQRGVDTPGGHLLDPRTRQAATSIASATVVAASAMLADAMATAAFVLGPRDGLSLLERHELDGLLVTPALEMHATAGMFRHYHLTSTGSGERSASATILPDA